MINKNIFCATLFASFGLYAEKNHTSNRLCSHSKSFVNTSRFCHTDERGAAFKRRVGAACLRTIQQKKNNIECQNNGDEKNVPFYAAQFSKTLEHDPVTGLLTAAGQANYQLYLKALKSGKQDDFNAIARAPGATMKLVNPQGAFTFSLEGTDSSLFKLQEFPTLSSPEAAALLIELYLMELCRDVYFSDYGTGTGTDATGVGTGSLTNNAASVLQALGSAYTGPRHLGVVDSTVLFRGTTYGNLVGPYISQFLLLDIRTTPVGAIGFQNLNQSLFVEFKQLRPSPAPSSEFGVSMSDFVAIENGKVPKQYVPTDYNSTNRYIIDGRDLSNLVHWDTPYEIYFNALKIICASGFPLSAACPYLNGSIKNESPFVSFGVPDAFALIGKVTNEVLKATWAQKWRADRALRPEAFGGLVQLTKTVGGNPFSLDNSIFAQYPTLGTDLLSLVQAHNALNGSPTFLLSMTYPEGSPAHPSYPQGHSSIAAACVTVIKAIFNDTVKFSSVIAPQKVNPIDPTALIPLPVSEGAGDITLGSELNKLVYNIANGRNFAGIHYRIDADNGALFGEQVAILFLQDHAATITEQTFTGFELTKLDGTRIRITAECVTQI